MWFSLQHCSETGEILVPTSICASLAENRRTVLKTASPQEPELEQLEPEIEDAKGILEVSPRSALGR
jgi:hypothetical protein